jgi:hypothetical protein
MKYFSSKDKLEPTTDGDDFGFNFLNSLETLVPSKVQVIYPAMPDFCNSSSLKRAKIVLKNYKIALPLETLVKIQHKQNLNKNIVRDKPAPIKKGGAPSKYQELLAIDTLHDVNSFVKNKSLLCRALSKELDIIPRKLKSDFVASLPTFTRDAFVYMKNKFPVSIVESDLDIDLRRTFDLNLSQMLASKLNPKEDLTFVLDNIVGSIQSNGDIGDAFFGLLGCAFIMVLVSNMGKLGMIKSNRIQFFDGLFMEMDGKYVGRFLQLFLKNIKKNGQGIFEANISSFKLLHYKSPDLKMVPIYFNKHLNVNSHVGNDANGTKYVEMNSKQYAIQGTGIHSKHKFAELIIQNKALKNDLVYLNFLRDAFKADMAIEHGYFYITHDRLAFLYYKYIGGNAGILLTQDVQDNNDYAILI